MYTKIDAFSHPVKFARGWDEGQMGINFCMSNKTTKKKILFVQPGAEERSSLSCMYNYQGSDVIHTSSPAFDTQSPPLACCKRLFTKPHPICRKPWRNIRFISSCRLRMHWYLSPVSMMNLKINSNILCVVEPTLLYAYNSRPIFIRYLSTILEDVLTLSLYAIMVWLLTPSPTGK